MKNRFGSVRMIRMRFSYHAFSTKPRGSGSLGFITPAFLHRRPVNESLNDALPFKRQRVEHLADCVDEKVAVVFIIVFGDDGQEFEQGLRLVDLTGIYETFARIEF